YYGSWDPRHWKVSPPRGGRFDPFVDRFGALASFLCALHCALLPIVFGVLPALGVGLLANHSFERVFVAFAVILAVTSLLFGLRRHGSYRAFWLLVPGIALLLGGMLVGDDHTDVTHAVLVSIGGTLVALSHIVNLRLGHVHGPACNH
ncbi:MAG: MerC domain-containing protein, partial [Dokdonella sp.]